MTNSFSVFMIYKKYVLNLVEFETNESNKFIVSKIQQDIENNMFLTLFNTVR